MGENLTNARVIKCPGKIKKGKIMDNLIAEGGCEPMIIVCEHGVANLAGEAPSGRFNLFNSS